MNALSSEESLISLQEYIDPALSDPKDSDLSGESWNAALKIVRTSGLRGLGEAYMSGLWKCPPNNLDKMLEKLVPHLPSRPWRAYLNLLSYLLRDLTLNLQAGTRAYEVAHRHYDLGNDLFRAMLDPSMSYTSGYWPKGCSSLADAQTAKLELICQKLALTPGMKILDIGCGWGNFAHYAASHYKVSVVGLTVSKEQAQLARERCRGLPVEIVLSDYRDYSGLFDRAVSIEMIEAVGRKNVPTFFEVVARCLKDDGIFLLQVISGDTFTKNSHPALNQFVLWLVEHIFPNGYLPRLSQLTKPAGNKLVLENVQNLKGDYEKTLIAWKENFDRNWNSLSANYDNRFQRMWHFYLCGCAVFFRLNIVQVYQVLYSKPASTK